MSGDVYVRFCGLSITHKYYNLTAISHLSAISTIRFHPRQSTRVPGGPSIFLAKYPPSFAISISTSAIVGGVVDRVLSREDLTISAVHSSSDKNSEQGTVGFVRAINVTINSRQATILITVR